MLFSGVAALFMARVRVRGEGTIRLGRRVRFDGSLAPIELHAMKGAEIVLDDDVYVEGGVSIEAMRSVHIGARTTIAAFTKIIDGHFHRLEGDRHQRPPPSTVVVEEDVVIGPHAILLPSAHVGRGSVVRAGTVITRRLPPGTIIGGAPAAVRGPVPEGRCRV